METEETAMEAFSKNIKSHLNRVHISRKERSVSSIVRTQLHWRQRRRSVSKTPQVKSFVIMSSMLFI